MPCGDPSSISRGRSPVPLEGLNICLVAICAATITDGSVASARTCDVLRCVLSARRGCVPTDETLGTVSSGPPSLSASLCCLALLLLTCAAFELGILLRGSTWCGASTRTTRPQEMEATGLAAGGGAVNRPGPCDDAARQREPSPAGASEHIRRALRRVGAARTVCRSETPAAPVPPLRQHGGAAHEPDLVASCRMPHVAAVIRVQRPVLSVSLGWWR